MTIDAFALMAPDQPIAFHWPFDLPVGQLHALEALAASLPYFGRADSICEAECSTAWTPPSQGTYVPLDLSDETGATQIAATELLAPVVPLDLTALTQRPVDVRKQRLRFPPGARLLPYAAAAPVEPVPRPRARRRSPVPPTAIRLALVGPALPPLTDTVVLADRLRRAALSRLGQGEHLDSGLAGRTPTGAQQQGGHGHAHYLTIGTDRRISDLVIWIPDGLSTRERAAVEGITYIWNGGRFGGKARDGEGAESEDAVALETTKIGLRVSAVGQIGAVAPELCGPSASWRSATPYCSPRHRKGDLNGFLHGDLKRELGHRHISSGQELVSMSLTPTDNGLAPIEYARARPSKRFARRGGRPQTGGFGPGEAPEVSEFLDLEFRGPVAGPIALGHLSHFGLGLFVPR